MVNPKSNIFIISGPSAAGEDSIIKRLEKLFPIEKVITTTTREIRPGETRGKSYYFVPKEEFLSGIIDGKFFEYAEEDRGNFYGVTQEEVARVMASNKVVIWKMDYKGVLTIKKLIPDAKAILLDVPLEVIEKRIRRRDIATEEYVKTRLDYAEGWYKNRDKFDYAVKNDEGRLDEAVAAVAKIIEENYNEKLN